MELFGIILQQIVKFTIMIGLGILCVKTKILEEKTIPTISKLIMRLLLPLFILYTVINGATREDIVSHASVIPIAIGVYAVIILVAWTLGKVFHLSPDRSSVYQAVLVFGNIGFIGIPLIAAIFPETGMMYIALYSIVDQLILWTYGIYLTSGATSKLSASHLKKMINPATCAVVLAVILVLLDVKLPALLMSTLQGVGSASSPLSLIYIGAALCFCNLKNVINKPELYGGIFIKMFCLPLLGFVVLYHGFHCDLDLATVMAIIIALPCMVSVPMMVKANNPSDAQGEYCIGANMLTQICSMVLIPIIAYLLTFLHT